MANEFIMLKNVRVSFPHLHTPPVFNGEPGKCGAGLMLHTSTDSAQIKKMEECISELVRDRLKNRRPASDKICLIDGDDSDRSEYAGHMVLSAKNKKRPVVMSTNGRDVVHDASECKIYAGCYVNAKIRLWAQDNAWGRRINCELIAIQFSGDGEALDGSHTSVESAMSGFEAVGGSGVDDWAA